MSVATEGARTARRRVPASERRDQLIEAAVAEFALGGLYGTAVAQIARRVGVAQPYVFSLFPTKRDLFLAAVESGFERIAAAFSRAAEAYARGEAPAECEDAMEAMGRAYSALLESDRDYLMLQHQSFAACEDPVVRERVRRCFAELIEHVRELSGADQERLDDFLRHGMALNVAAALGIGDLCAGAEWVSDELAAQ